MEAVPLILLGVVVIAVVMFRLRERRAERLERLNRESWELYRASRRIHDMTVEALQALFEEARSTSTGLVSARDIER